MNKKVLFFVDMTISKIKGGYLHMNFIKINIVITKHISLDGAYEMVLYTKSYFFFKFMKGGLLELSYLKYVFLAY